MSYTDVEMMLATQVAYLDYYETGQAEDMTVGDLVDSVLQQYGVYDSAAGTYTMKENVTGAAKAQFEYAQSIVQYGEQYNTDSWQNWVVVDSRNNNNQSGFYGCLIETGEGKAIVGCRGSESYDSDQVMKDWISADLGRLNNPLTVQQKDATEYVNYLYETYGEEYDSFCFTGHSLGGSLATHAAITAPEGMQEKTETVISFDGPGFSDEYLKVHEAEIEKMKDKLNHYEYSFVGSLLNQPEGINNRIIRAHDDQIEDSDWKAQLFRHHTRNIEFDENGNVIDGERGVLQALLGPSSEKLENSFMWEQIIFLKEYIFMILYSYLISVAAGKMEDIVQEIQNKMEQLFESYLSYAISGEYEIHLGEMMRMSDDLDSVQSRLNSIADQVNTIKRDLPYDSMSAYYYRHCLGKISNALVSDGKKAKKISTVVDKAAVKYDRGDQNVSAMF